MKSMVNLKYFMYVDSQITGIQLPGLLIQVKAIHKDGSTFLISQSQYVNREGDLLIFIANFEKNQVAECTITFDIRGTILLCTSQVSLIILPF
jgi:hypothetical protein